MTETTESGLQVFLRIARQADARRGMSHPDYDLAPDLPMLQRLKDAGFILFGTLDGRDFVYFTDDGVDLAAANGINLNDTDDC